MRDVYVDESSQSQNHYLVIGALVVETARAAELESRLQTILVESNTRGELKWGKVSAGKLPVYKALVDELLAATREGLVHFHALIVDNHAIDHHTYNFGDSDLGFSKFLYQLLMHKVGRTYGAKQKLHVYLDDRTTKHSPDDLRLMLNRGLSRKWRIKTDPFRRIVFTCSKQSRLIQMTDLLIGCIQFQKNGLHLKADASAAKKDLAAHVAAQLGVRTLGADTAMREHRVTMWNFRLQKRGGPGGLGR